MTLKQLVEAAIDYVATGFTPRPYQVMTKVKVANILLLIELTDRGELPSNLTGRATQEAKGWFDAGWMSIVWEARHTGYNPEEARKEISIEGLDAAIYLYQSKPFPPSYGGAKWADISRAAKNAYQLYLDGAFRGMMDALRIMLYTEHNTGLFGEKLCTPEAKSMLKYYREGTDTVYDLMPYADKPIRAAAEKVFGRPEDQPARFSRKSIMWDADWDFDKTKKPPWPETPNVSKIPLTKNALPAKGHYTPGKSKFSFQARGHEIFGEDLLDDPLP